MVFIGRNPRKGAMKVKLTQPLPAFRIDDAAVLERLWRVLEAKCAEAGPPWGSLSVSEKVRVAGRRTPEEHEHEHEYRNIDELRRTPGGPVLLRDYRLYVSTPGDSDGRCASFRASSFGAASVEANAPDAAWCREVGAAFLAAAMVSVEVLGWHPAVALPLWSSFLVLAMWQDRIFRRRHPRPASRRTTRPARERGVRRPTSRPGSRRNRGARGGAAA